MKHFLRLHWDLLLRGENLMDFSPTLDPETLQPSQLHSLEPGRSSYFQLSSAASRPSLFHSHSRAHLSNHMLGAIKQAHLPVRTRGPFAGNDPDRLVCNWITDAKFRYLAAGAGVRQPRFPLVDWGCFNLCMSSKLKGRHESLEVFSTMSSTRRTMQTSPRISHLAALRVPIR